MRNPEFSRFDPSMADRAWKLLRQTIKDGNPVDQDAIYKAIDETTPELKHPKDARAKHDRSRLIAVLNESVEKELKRRNRVLMRGAQENEEFHRDRVGD